MYQLVTIIAWVLLTVLAITWLFLPWIIISKMDQLIYEIRILSQTLAKKAP